MLAPVNKIIPFSLVDGPGSRCSVFLQACNIACVYCHNPETQQLCVDCGACVEPCPADALSLVDGRVLWDRAACVGCDNCIKLCPHNASPKVLRMEAQEVYEQAASYAPFIRGITVSGGECMLYPEWLEELFRLCRAAGLSCLVDSNGTIPFAEHPALVDVCDGVMLDVKAWDPDVAQHLTGQDASQTATVKDNLLFLAHAGKLEEIRIVVVDGWSDPEASIRGCAELLGELTSAQRLRITKFRSFGVRGPLADAASPTDNRIAELVALARTCGFEDIVLS